MLILLWAHLSIKSFFLWVDLIWFVFFGRTEEKFLWAAFFLVMQSVNTAFIEKLFWSVILILETHWLESSYLHWKVYRDTCNFVTAPGLLIAVTVHVSVLLKCVVQLSLMNCRYGGTVLHCTAGTIRTTQTSTCALCVQKCPSASTWFWISLPLRHSRRFKKKITILASMLIWENTNRLLENHKTDWGGKKACDHLTQNEKLVPRNETLSHNIQQQFVIFITKDKIILSK